MPIYEYRCENGHQFEVIQSMADDPVTACEECGAPVERVFHPIAVHFKGSGFYTTDYAKKGQSGAAATKDGESKPSSDSGSSSSSDGDSGSDSGSGTGEKKSDSKKSDSGSTTKTASSSD